MSEVGDSYLTWARVGSAEQGVQTDLFNTWLLTLVKMLYLRLFVEV